jgi:hypothetical protein
MAVIGRCYPEFVDADGSVTVCGRRPTSPRPSLRYGAEPQKAEQQIFVWPIGRDLAQRGSITLFQREGKSFKIRASFDAQSPARRFGNNDLEAPRDGQPPPYYAIVKKVGEFRPASMIGVDDDEAAFLNELYNRTNNLSRMYATADAPNEASLVTDTSADAVSETPVRNNDNPEPVDSSREATADGDVASDVADIFSDPTLTNETERLALVQVRLGQGQFRAELLRRWDGHCPVTGCSQEQALRASHIKPWRSSTREEQTNPANGLLLTANLDALFDKFFISFDDDGRMLVSPQVEEACYEILGIPGRRIRGLSLEERRFLAYHRTQAGFS